jgi:hypothetical protein
MKNENELNENEMSLTNMPAIIVPTPLPLVRAEHETNCPCSFCQKKRISVQELKEAIKEVPQIVALDKRILVQELKEAIKEVSQIIALDKRNEDLMNEPLQEDELWSALSNSTLEWGDYDLDFLLDEEEEILLQPATRSLQDFPIPTLSRSTNDPSTWDDEILL